MPTASRSPSGRSPDFAELLDLVDESAYRERWLDYCQFYNAPDAEFQAKTGAPGRGRALREAHARFTAYAARHRDPMLADCARAEFRGGNPASAPVPLSGATVLKPVDELPGVSTNDVAQWGLTAGQVVALLGPPPG